MLLVEAAVAITGVSGVVVVFGRRAEGEWSQLERERLVNLLTTSFSVLFLSLAALVLLHAGTDPATTWRIGSAAWSILSVFEMVLTARRAGRHSRDGPEVPHRAGSESLRSRTGVLV